MNRIGDDISRHAKLGAEITRSAAEILRTIDSGIRELENQKSVSFEVHGIPQTQGSMKAFMPKGARFAVATHQNATVLMSWRGLIASEASKHAPREKDFHKTEETIVPWTGPCKIELVFRLQRPKAHYKKNGTGDLRRSAPSHPDGSLKDLDKLIRAVLDALSGILFRDDGQVCEIIAKKEYGAAGAVITLQRLL